MSRLDLERGLKYHATQTKLWGGQVSQLKYLFLAMRPRQWIKNLLLFMALIFSLNLYWDFDDLGNAGYLLGTTIAAFALFCLLSSAEYLSNDLLDLEADRRHPRKRERPIASGKLRLPVARAAAVLLPAITLLLGYWLNWAFGVVATIYFVLALSYSLFLKKLVLIDVFAIAVGFVLRAVAGAVVLDFPISPWLYICTLLLALFLALSKRRQELVLLEANPGKYRQTLAEYTPKLVDEMIALVTAATVIGYSLYTFTAQNLPRNHAMMLTVPFVLYGVFRYLYLMHVKGMGGSPEEALLTDKPLIATVSLWALAAFLVLLLSGRPS